ncbi:Hypothetical_protein [Hexamita inflata]|uniref:Hypothetical_protein n=1 Tax=Hexamita inflata TaxID=28002 RepID=A0AA86TKE7_9EUKA|nr:Hypothetical protein HINF_LOCUS5957 [Hexamita inflata]
MGCDDSSNVESNENIMSEVDAMSRIISDQLELLIDKKRTLHRKLKDQENEERDRLALTYLQVDQNISIREILSISFVNLKNEHKLHSKEALVAASNILYQCGLFGCQKDEFEAYLTKLGYCLIISNVDVSLVSLQNQKISPEMVQRLLDRMDAGEESSNLE